MESPQRAMVQPEVVIVVRIQLHRYAVWDRVRLEQIPVRRQRMIQVHVMVHQIAVKVRDAKLGARRRLGRVWGGRVLEHHLLLDEHIVGVVAGTGRVQIRFHLNNGRCCQGR